MFYYLLPLILSLARKCHSSCIPIPILPFHLVCKKNIRHVPIPMENSMEDLYPLSRCVPQLNIGCLITIQLNILNWLLSGSGKRRWRCVILSLSHSAPCDWCGGGVLCEPPDSLLSFLSLCSDCCWRFHLESLCVRAVWEQTIMSRRAHNNQELSPSVCNWGPSWGGSTPDK